MSIVIILLGAALIVLGYFHYKKPESFWEWNEGWKVKGDSEPSELYIMWTKQVGIVLAIIGLIVYAGGLIALFA